MPRARARPPLARFYTRHCDHSVVAIIGSQRLRRIDDQRHPVALAQRLDAPVVAALAVKVHRHHGLGHPPLGRGLRQRLLQQIRIYRPACLVAIDEHRLSPAPHRRRDRRDEGQIRAEHTVTGPDPQLVKQQLERSSPARQRAGVLDANALGERALEAVHHRPARCDIAGCESLFHPSPFAAAQPRRRQKNPFAHNAPSPHDAMQHAAALERRRPVKDRLRHIAPNRRHHIAAVRRRAQLPHDRLVRLILPEGQPAP